jgi:hypothetical protein
MTRYDVTLKSVLRDGKTEVLRSLGMAGDYEELSPVFPSARERRTDFLVVVRSPRKRAFLAHVELQTDRDGNMTNRMLGYLADIRQWATGTKYKGMRVQQTVVYVGPRRWSPATQIREQGLRFDYDFVDAKTLDPEPLLASANLGDVTFAVLCRDGKRADVIRRVLQRIKEAPTSERPDVIAKLSILADLRNIGAQVKAEMERMGIPVNIEDSTLVRPVIERVREETLHASSIDSITRVLRSRFDRLPADLGAKLEKLSQDELNRVLDQAGTAGSIDAALAIEAPAAKP